MEVKFLRSVAGQVLHEHTANEEIRELNAYSLNGVIVDYRRQQTQHLLRINYIFIRNLVYE